MSLKQLLSQHSSLRDWLMSGSMSIYNFILFGWDETYKFKCAIFVKPTQCNRTVYQDDLNIHAKDDKDWSKRHKTNTIIWNEFLKIDYNQLSFVLPEAPGFVAIKTDANRLLQWHTTNYVSS